MSGYTTTTSEKKTFSLVDFQGMLDLARKAGKAPTISKLVCSARFADALKKAADEISNRQSRDISTLGGIKVVVSSALSGSQIVLLDRNDNVIFVTKDGKIVEAPEKLRGEESWCRDLKGTIITKDIS